MKTASNNLLHKMENKLGLLLSSIDAMEANLDDAEYLKEVIAEIRNKKDEMNDFMNELREVLGAAK
jgi:Tfp pilus assembly protein PilN